MAYSDNSDEERYFDTFAEPRDVDDRNFTPPDSPYSRVSDLSRNSRGRHISGIPNYQNGQFSGRDIHRDFDGRQNYQCHDRQFNGRQGYIREPVFDRRFDPVYDLEHNFHTGFQPQGAFQNLPGNHLGHQYDQPGDFQNYRHGFQSDFQDRNVGKYKKPPTYDGKSSFKDFLVQFEILADSVGWNDTIRARELATCLRDQAVSVLADLDQFQRRHYSSLVSALIARFEPDNQMQLYRAQLKSRIRKPDEALPELAQDIRKLVREANPGLASDLREGLAKDYFMDSLNDKDLEYAVFQSQATTLQEALKVAVEFEAFQKSRCRKIPLRTVKNTSDNNLDQDFVAQLTKRIDELQDELKQIKLSKNTGETFKSQDNTEKPQKGAKQKHKGQIKCYYCDKVGHISRFCLKRKNDEKQKNSEQKSKDSKSDSLNRE